MSRLHEASRLKGNKLRQKTQEMTSHLLYVLLLCFVNLK